MKLFTEAKPVARWFTTQQKVGGGYGSTQVSLCWDCHFPAAWRGAEPYRFHFAFQATFMVYQAVAEYWANSKEPEYDVSVDIRMPGRSRPEKYKVNRNNHYTTRTTKVKKHTASDERRTQVSSSHSILFMCLFFFFPFSSGEYHKSGRDRGGQRVRWSNSKSKTLIEVSPYRESQLHISDAIPTACQMVSLYYAMPREKASDCQKFHLSVQLIPGKAALSLFAFLVFWGGKKKKGPNVDWTFLHWQIHRVGTRKCTSWE